MLALRQVALNTISKIHFECQHWLKAACIITKLYQSVGFTSQYILLITTWCLIPTKIIRA